MSLIGINIRPIEQKDRDYILKKMLKCYYKTKKPIIRDTKVEYSEILVDEMIKQYECKSVIINETYLLCYLCHDTWWTHFKLFTEYSVMKIYNGPGTFKDVVDAIEHLARINNCKHIQVGTMFAPRDSSLCKIYENFGFEQQCVTLVKTLE